tara:strand:- start:118 stop:336 length:219 start_codon:yes stop_codon:yes gene_type:complete
MKKLLSITTSLLFIVSCGGGGGGGSSSGGGDGQHAHEFKEYPGITFYMPAGQGYHGQTSSSGELSFKTKSHY